MTNSIIPFNRPYMTGKELFYVAESHFNGRLAGDGPFTRLCHEWLQDRTGCEKSLLTHSCTAALEMAAMLLNIEPGDEVIVPSFTFVSTANAFVLRGGIPVFVDVRSDTMNIDEKLIEEAITERTRAIVPVHYAGVSCEMDDIMNVAARYGLNVVEDAAQGIMSSYKGRSLGSIGDIGAFSFHETKNVICGEGGAILVNQPELVSRSEVIREKGTDRSRFFRGEVDKYTWQEIGSSFLPGELIAAFLWAQLQEAGQITEERMSRWNYYHTNLAELESNGVLRRPIVPDHCVHNAHMYYILLSPEFDRQQVLDRLNRNGIRAIFHYVPLHSSPAGSRYGRPHGELAVTVQQSEKLIRLPLWMGLSSVQQDRVIDELKNAIFNN